MLALFHGQELGLVFGLAFAIPSALALFVLFSWKTQEKSPFLRILKAILVLVSVLFGAFALFLIFFGFQEFKDNYL